MLGKKELWKPVLGLEGKYEVSDRGRVRSRYRVRRTHANGEGYLQATLPFSTGPRSVGVHRLVLEAFVGPCPEGKQAAHLDGNPGNNRVENLVWATPGENARHKIRHGTVGKITLEQAREIRRRYSRPGRKLGRRVQLAKDYGITPGNITAILANRTWKEAQNCTS